jgi:hypothetical protein
VIEDESSNGLWENRALGTVDACPYGGKARFAGGGASAWAVATDFYAGYERYRVSCAPREIRLFRLRPTAA